MREEARNLLNYHTEICIMMRMNTQERLKWRGIAMLFFTALIWGTAFAAQRVAGQYIGAFTFNSARFLIGAVALLPVLAASVHRGRRLGRPVNLGGRKLVVGGVLCGVALFLAGNLQQFGIEETTAGKAGFITALYIVLVPVFSIPLKKRPGFATWIGAAVALAGMYLLCMKEGFTVSTGDLYVLCCAVCFAVQILLIDHYSPVVNGVALSCIQFVVAGMLGCIPALLLESPTVSAVLAAWQPILFVGVISCGVAYTLQILAQRHVPAPVASLIMSLESVFAALAGVLLLNETMSAREAIGCALMLAAVLLVQLWRPGRRKSPGKAARA